MPPKKTATPKVTSSTTSPKKKQPSSNDPEIKQPSEKVEKINPTTSTSTKEKIQESPKVEFYEPLSPLVELEGINSAREILSFATKQNVVIGWTDYGNTYQVRFKKSPTQTYRAGELVNALKEILRQTLPGEKTE